MIGKMIKNVRLKKGIKLNQLAQMTDIDIGHLSHIEKAERFPSYKALKQICNALDVPVAQFLNYTGKTLNEEQEEYGYVEYIPYGLIPVVDVKKYVEAPKNTDKNVMGVIIKDNSMEEKIKKGSTIFIEFYTPVNNKEVGLFSVNGNIVIREFRLKGTKISLKAYNKEYKDIVIGEEDDFKIIGRMLKA